jgi:hypothetical protein
VGVESEMAGFFSDENATSEPRSKKKRFLQMNGLTFEKKTTAQLNYSRFSKIKAFREVV